MVVFQFNRSLKKILIIKNLKCSASRQRRTVHPRCGAARPRGLRGGGAAVRHCCKRYPSWPEYCKFRTRGVPNARSLDLRIANGCRVRLRRLEMLSLLWKSTLSKALGKSTSSSVVLPVHAERPVDSDAVLYHVVLQDRIYKQNSSYGVHSKPKTGKAGPSTLHRGKTGHALAHG
jgi:hypothetical protein